MPVIDIDNRLAHMIMENQELQLFSQSWSPFCRMIPVSVSKTVRGTRVLSIPSRHFLLERYVGAFHETL